MDFNAKEKSGAGKGLRQLVPAVLFAGMGVMLLLSTFLLFYRPMQQNNKALSDERLKERMQLSTLIADVFPAMNVDDELTDAIHRALESKKKTWSKESAQVAGEIEQLRQDNALISQLLTDTGYDTGDFNEIVKERLILCCIANCLFIGNCTTCSIDKHKMLF